PNGRHKLPQAAEAIQPIFFPCLFAVETNARPSDGTAEGRQEQTDEQPDNPNSIRTSGGCESPPNIGWL
ncbi:hypothetical protein, partial [Bacteroides fragilis]|uniref:hypothetical protein n=1 Tax=Bacteroides fragilis TaxID=817 RepID=UPI000665EC89